MGCRHHPTPPPFVHLTEEMILDGTWLPGSMAGWRRYRVEYGFECSCPEGTIYLPPDLMPEVLERLLNVDGPEDDAEEEDV